MLGLGVLEATFQPAMSSNQAKEAIALCQCLILKAAIMFKTVTALF